MTNEKEQEIIKKGKWKRAKKKLIEWGGILSINWAVKWQQWEWTEYNIGNDNDDDVRYILVEERAGARLERVRQLQPTTDWLAGWLLLFLTRRRRASPQSKTVHLPSTPVPRPAPRITHVYYLTQTRARDPISNVLYGKNFGWLFSICTHYHHHHRCHVYSIFNPV